MEFYLIALIKTLVLPPGGIVVGILAALVLTRRFPRLGKTLTCVVASLGILIMTPLIASWLASLTEVADAIDLAEIDSLEADAIVILAGGKDHGREEYGGTTVSASTLQRIRYGAYLQRKLNLPVAVSGGVVLGEGIGEAQLMGNILQEEYFVSAKWVESSSRNTAQNALFTRQLMGKKRILLVTQSMHMHRSMKAFQQVGFDVIPAPVAAQGLNENYKFSIFDLLPSEKALVVSRAALHEWLGLVWYAIRYGTLYKHVE